MFCTKQQILQCEPHVIDEVLLLTVQRATNKLCKPCKTNCKDVECLLLATNTRYSSPVVCRSIHIDSAFFFLVPAIFYFPKHVFCKVYFTGGWQKKESVHYLGECRCLHDSILLLWSPSCSIPLEAGLFTVCCCIWVCFSYFIFSL